MLEELQAAASSESEPERIFAAALVKALPSSITAKQQVDVDTSRGRYRVDFMLSGVKRYRVAVEVDGMAYHADTMAEDRQRDRALAEAGIVTVRFMASEIYENAAVCAYEATDIALSWVG
jgi:very-short-patch-repair endonuclease